MSHSHQFYAFLYRIRSLRKLIIYQQTVAVTADVRSFPSNNVVHICFLAYLSLMGSAPPQNPFPPPPPLLDLPLANVIIPSRIPIAYALSHNDST